MTNLARLVPHIMDQTDHGTRGWSRRWQLVGVVAARTWYPGTWTELGIRELEELGRTRAEARHDRDLLQALAADGILVRLSAGGHRRADLWRIAGDSLDSLRRWRHVPWLVSREHAISVLRALEPGVSNEFDVESPGRSAAIGTGGPGFSTLGAPKHPAQGESRPHQSGRYPYQSSPVSPPTTTPDVPKLTDPEPSTQCLLSTTYSSPSLGSEGGSEEQLAEAYRPVLNALQNTLGRPCIGAQAERLRGIVAAQLDHHEAMADYVVGTFRGMYSVRAALDLLEAWTPAVVSDGPDPAAVAKRIDNLRRLIATFTNSDPDRAAELQAELEALEQ